MRRHQSLRCSLGSCSSTRSSCRRRFTPSGPLVLKIPRPTPRPSGVITGRTGRPWRRALPTACPSNAGSRRCLRTTAATACSRGRRGASCWPAPGGGSLHLPGERWAGYLRAYPRGAPARHRASAPPRTGPGTSWISAPPPPGPNWPLNFPRAGTWCFRTQSLHSHGSASPYRGLHPRRALGHGGGRRAFVPGPLGAVPAPGTGGAPCRCLGVSRRQGGARGNAGGSSGPGALGRA